MKARWVIRGFLGLIVIMCFVLAGTYFAGPDVSAPAGRTLTDELRVVGAHWVAAGIVLVLALLAAGNRVLAWLLIAQAISGTINAVIEVINGYPPAAYPAFGTSVLLAITAGWLLRQPDQPSVTRRRSDVRVPVHPPCSGDVDA